MKKQLKRYIFFMLAGLWLVCGSASFARAACDMHEVLQQQRFEENLAIKQHAIKQCLNAGGQASDLDKNGFSTLSTSIVLSDFEAVYILLDTGVDPNIKNADGARPMHALVQRGTLPWPIWKRLAELLIASGADVNATDNDGDTALHYAALQETGADRIQFLLDHEGDPNITNRRGQTPLFSTLQGECKSGPGLTLLKGGARLDAMSEFWVDMLLDVSAMLCAEEDEREFASRLQAGNAD